MSTFEQNVDLVLGELKVILLAKNEKYGNSALEPVRVFSKASPKEQILVRLDDKLSRLRTQHINEDEDVATDLMGYLVLLKIADMQTPCEVEPTDDTDVKIIEEWLENSVFDLAYLTPDGQIELTDSRHGRPNQMFKDYDAFLEWYKADCVELYNEKKHAVQ